MKNTRFLVALAPIALAAALAGCGKPAATAAPEPTKEAAAQAVATRLAVVQDVDFTQVLQLDGEVANLYSPDVAAEVAGKVLAVKVEPGQRVRAGQALVQIEAADLALSVAADKAEVARLSAVAADRQSLAQRLAPLAEQELVSKASFTSARQDATAAAAAVQAAQARLAQTTRNLHKSEVTAPFDAQVAERRVAPGAYVRAGDVLVSLVRTEGSYLKVQVPESQAHLVHPGLEVSAVLAGAAPIKAEVSALQPRTTGVSRVVEASVALPSGALARPGSSARVQLRLQEKLGLGVPETAVVTEADRAFVFVLADQVFHKTAVKLGARAAGQAEILEGVVAGAQVAQDASFLFEGARYAGGAQ